VDRAVTDAWIDRALGYVPSGDHEQRKFRAILNMSFRNALGPTPEHPGWSVAEVVQEAIEQLGCKPRFDSALLTLSWPDD
jgi:hypothetical protein